MELYFEVDKYNDITHTISMRPAKLFQLARNNPQGLRFSELRRLAEAFGFEFQRQKGSHRVYAHAGIIEIMNFQMIEGRRSLIKFDNCLPASIAMGWL